MRLIDADALLKTFYRELDNAILYGRIVKPLQELIKEAPSVDAVPVVRCKDCVHGTDRTDDFQEEDERWDVVNPIACMMYSSDGIPDFFPMNNYCGFAERKDDEPLMEHEVLFGKEE